MDSQYPNGHFVRSIGPIGDIETETAVILIEHQLATHSFSKAMLAGKKSILVPKPVKGMNRTSWPLTHSARQCFQVYYVKYLFPPPPKLAKLCRGKQ